MEVDGAGEYFSVLSRVPPAVFMNRRANSSMWFIFLCSVCLECCNLRRFHSFHSRSARIRAYTPLLSLEDCIKLLLSDKFTSGI